MPEPTTAVVPARPDERRALQPTRDVRATLPDLLEVLLNKGVYLDLDLIITVADIPLIGVNLKAAVAGIETMLEHGMMRGWDAQTREWVRRSLARRVPLEQGEDVVARMAGGYRQEEPAVLWRPGTVYLTSRRLMVWRSEPRELIWQAALDDVTDADLREERSVGGEVRTRVAVGTSRGTAVLSAAAPDRLLDLLREHAALAAREREHPSTALDGSLWFHEDLGRGGVWRGGNATVGPSGFTWKGLRETRAAVRLGPGEVLSVDVEGSRSPIGGEVIVITTPSGQVRLATRATARWLRALGELVTPHDGGTP